MIRNTVIIRAVKRENYTLINNINIYNQTGILYLYEDTG